MQSQCWTSSPPGRKLTGRDGGKKKREQTLLPSYLNRVLRFASVASTLNIPEIYLLTILYSVPLHLPTTYTKCTPRLDTSLLFDHLTRSPFARKKRKVLVVPPKLVGGVTRGPWTAMLALRRKVFHPC